MNPERIYIWLTDNGHIRKWQSEQFDEGTEYVRVDLLAALSQPAAEQHPDDAAVDRFAAAMKAKMAASRGKGRGGWDDDSQCSVEYLADLLCGHLSKGDPVDVANFAMMLWHREGGSEALSEDGFAQLIEQARTEGAKAMRQVLGEAGPATSTNPLTALEAKVDRVLEILTPRPWVGGPR